MDDRELATLLRSADPFGGVDDEGLDRLLGIAERQAFTAGDVVVVEGAEGDAAFLCVAGRLRVETDDFAAEKKRIATIEVGALFGEISAISGEPRNATIVAEAEGELLRFELVSLLNVLKDYPKVLEALKRLSISRSAALIEQVLSEP